MKKETIELIKEFFNYNSERNNIFRLNILIAMWLVSALILTVLIFCVNSFLGKVISIMFCLITWIAGVGYGLIYKSIKHKELLIHRNKIRKLLEDENKS